MNMIRKSLKMLFLDKVRFVLTMIALVISFSVVISFSMFKASYFRTMISSYDIFKEDKLISVKYENSDIDKYNQYAKSNYIDFSEPTKIFYQGSSKIDVYINISTVAIGNKGSTIPIISNYDTVQKPQVISGTWFTEKNFTDSEDVVVITKDAAYIFFENGNAVDKYIDIPVYEKVGSMNVIGYKTYLVIGVIDNYGKRVTDGDSLIYELEVFTPSDFYIKNKKGFRIYYQVEDVNNSVQNMTALSLSERKSDKYIFNTYDQYIKLARDDFSVLERTFNFFNYIFNVIVGIIIINSLFFSIKSRVSEIGISRALGARRVDVFMQFLLETIIYSIIAIIFSFTLSIGITQVLINYSGVSTMIFSINFTELIISLTIPLVIIFISSSLVSIYAAYLPIVDAIKYE